MFSNRSPWRRPCKWSKHFGDHRTIKYTNKIRVDLLVFHNYQIYSIHKTPLNVRAPYETATASPAYLSTQNARSPLRNSNCKSSIPLHTERTQPPTKQQLQVQHTSPHRTHAHTLNVMLPHHHIDFLHFKQILKLVTLTRNIRAPWRWSEYDRNMLEHF